MALWEQIALAGMALVVLFVFGPGAKAMVESSRKASGSDWLAFLIPISAVIGFVLLLILLAKA